MLSLESSYAALRETAGVYSRGTDVIAIRGAERAELASKLMAKSIEFVSSNTCVDSLVLNADGSVAGTVLVIHTDDDYIVVVDADAAWIDSAREVAAEFDAELVSPGQRAIAVEGPRSWEVVDPFFGDEDIADLLLNEANEIDHDGVTGIIARVGTTAEFGYLLITDATNALDRIRTEAESVDGGEIDPAVLGRVRAETNFPVLPEQAADATVLEAGIAWLISMERDDEFVGSSVLEVAAPVRRTVAALIDGDCPAAGTDVFDGETKVGRVQVATERAGQETGLALLLLDDPYGVPGLELTVDGRTARTVSRPCIAPKSWATQIGVR